MAIQYTNPNTTVSPTPVATDVFNAPILKPDAKLAELQAKAEKAIGQELEKINEQINARQLEIMQEQGFTNVGFGSYGSYVPGAGQGVGYQILEPTGIPGVYSKSSIGTDTSVDPYGRVSVGDTSTFREFYDENGNPIDKSQIASTKLGKALASKGWDIGYGAGSLGPNAGFDTTTTTLPFTGNASTTTLPFTESTSTKNLGTTTNAGFGPGSTGYEDRKSAYDILFQEFNRYGLGAMVEPLKSLITEGVSPSEFGLRLTQTDAYKKRFAANQDRINKGLRALTPAEYIGLEDQYQSIMRNYGLPASYYTKGDLGTQEGFNKLLASDVSAAELEDRIATAQKRVLNTNPEVLQALKQFYPDLNNADILAYTLDPDKALSEIQRKVTAAEIGGAALAQGLQAQGGTAEALAGYGITKAQAQQGYQTIGEFLPTAQKLGDIYQNQGLGAYDQATAEREVFGTAGAASAAQKRKKLAQLEQATFAGQAGTSQGALDRGRQGSF